MARTCARRGGRASCESVRHGIDTRGASRTLVPPSEELPMIPFLHGFRTSAIHVAASLLFVAGIAIAATPIRAAEPTDAPAGKTMQEVLAASSPTDWRAPDPASTLYLELAAGRV